MVNSLLTATAISRVTIELLRRDIVLPQTVMRPPSTDFAGPSGGTVNFRLRQNRDSRIQVNPGDAITFDDIAEDSVPVTVRHIYDAARLADEDLSLTIEDFVSQVTEPQIDSIVRGAEDELADAMNALTPDISFTVEDEVDAAVLQARENLGLANVPISPRWLAVSPGFATLLLGKPNLTPFDSPPTPSALTDAIIGTYRGFRVVESSALTENTALAYHPSAFLFGMRTPVTPRSLSGSQVAVVSDSGITFRQVFVFIDNILSESSILSVFAGASTTDVFRVEKIEFLGS